jgi:hypothetical protein
MTNREAFAVVAATLNRQQDRIRKLTRDTRNERLMNEVKQEIADALAALGELTKNADRKEFVSQSTMFDLAELDTPPTKAVRSY